MSQTLALINDGTAEFDGEIITIKDKKTRWSYRLMHLTSMLWVPICIIFLFHEDFDSRSWITWLYALVLIAQLIVSIYLFRLSWQEKVLLDEVKSSRIKTGFNNANLILYLKNGKQRRLHASKHDESAVRSFVGTIFPA